MFLQGKICVSARVSKSFAKCLLSEFSILKIDPHRVMISPVIFDSKMLLASQNIG